VANTKTELIKSVRYLLDDLVGSGSSLYWSDNELESYYVEAINLFCRLTRCIKDSLTDSICLLDVPAGGRHLALHPAVLPNQIDLTSTSWGRSLLPATLAELEQFQQNWQTDSGIPDRYILDYSDGYLTLNRSVATAGTIRLTVRRMPIDPAAEAPEIPVMYLDYLKDYMLYLAFIKQDSEIYNPQKGLFHLKEFRGDSEDTPGGHCGRVLKERSGRLPQQRIVRTF